MPYCSIGATDDNLYTEEKSWALYALCSSSFCHPIDNYCRGLIDGRLAMPTYDDGVLKLPMVLYGTMVYESIHNVSPGDDIYDFLDRLPHWNSSVSTPQQGFFDCSNGSYRGTVNVATKGFCVMGAGTSITAAKSWETSHTYYPFDAEGELKTKLAIWTEWKAMPPADYSGAIQLTAIGHVKDSIFLHYDDIFGPHPVKINYGDLDVDKSVFTTSGLNHNGTLTQATVDRSTLALVDDVMTIVAKPEGGAINKVDSCCVKIQDSLTVWDIDFSGSDVTLEGSYTSEPGELEEGISNCDTLTLRGCKGQIAVVGLVSMGVYKIIGLDVGSTLIKLTVGGYNNSCRVDMTIACPTKKVGSLFFDTEIGSALIDNSYHKYVLSNCTFADVAMRIYVTHSVGFTPPQATIVNGVATPFTVIISGIHFDPSDESQAEYWAESGGVMTYTIHYGAGSLEPKHPSAFGVPVNKLGPTPNLPSVQNKLGGDELRNYIEKKEDYSKLFSGPGGGETKVNNTAQYTEFIEGSEGDGTGAPCLQ